MSPSRFAVVLALGTLLASRPLHAQPARPLALGLAVDAETVPDAFSSQCGDANTGSLGMGVNVSLNGHPRGGLVVQGDAHLLAASLDTGCDLRLRTTPLPNGGYAIEGGRRYPGTTPAGQFMTTSVRAGIETPRGTPLVRLLVGGGAVVSSHGVLPLGVASLGTGTRGAHARLAVEWQYAISTVNTTVVREVHATRAADAISVATVHDRLWPRWSTVRAGVELPLGGR